MSAFQDLAVHADHRVHALSLRQAGPLLDALRQQRFEPIRYMGRPVAVSVYRLISRMDVSI